MKEQLASELRKLTTTRSSSAMFGGLLALVALVVVAIVTDNDPLAIRVPLQEQPFLRAPLTLLVSLFALMFGIRSFTDEFRNGSIVPTLLANPSRDRVLGAKLAAAALGGVVMTMGATVLALAVGVPLLIGEGVAITWSPAEMFVVVGRLAGVATLWTAIGVGFGLAVRHQVAAIAGALIWILAAESLLSGYLREIASYLPGQATGSLTGVDALELLPPGVAAMVLTGWALLATVAGRVMMARRDIT